MVTAIQEDTLIMKNIEAVQIINYALTVINKWTNESVNKNYLLQIDEQLGMISSVVNIITGTYPSFSFDNGGKVTFDTPELKELGTKEYAKKNRQNILLLQKRMKLK
ncbi:MAG: hypothetical protein IPN13_07875 [Bacteroidetes bacterium]|nr:hypothetical protein [Bacteroidota bacterium]